MTEVPCVFCDPAESKVMCESGSMLARFDNFPAAPGHVEIIPRRHVESLWDLTDTEAADLWRLLREARTRIDAEYAPDGYTIGVNEGRAAGRSIDHLHVHLIPRHDGDVPDPAGGIRRIFPGCDPGLWAVTTREDTATEASGCADHTPAPTGYLAWHEWAERMSATHQQRRCLGCGLYAIWIPDKDHPGAKPIDPADVGSSCRAARLII